MILAVSGCERQQEHIAKFIFDNSQTSEKTVHIYKYDGTNIETDSSTTYMYLNGVLYDSSTSVIDYQYDKESRSITMMDRLDSSVQIKIYNEIDTLITEYSITNEGDTTFLITRDFENGRIKKRANRMLMMNIPESLEGFTKENLRNYDTLYFLSEYIYKGDLIDIAISKDKNGEVTEEIKHIYDNNKLIKTITYSFLGESRYLSETTNFYDNSTDEPDSYSINSSGDTTAFVKTIIENELEITLTYSSESNMQNIWYYNKIGQLSGMVTLDFEGMTKYVYSYEYDDKGNEITVKNYREKISNAL